MTSQTFTISGMTCEACTKLTAKRIKNIDGVHDARVDLEAKTAIVEAERSITAQEINTAFGDSSYRAEDN
jgi:copper chaperone CopZ